MSEEIVEVVALTCPCGKKVNYDSPNHGAIKDGPTAKAIRLVFYLVLCPIAQSRNRR